MLQGAIEKSIKSMMRPRPGEVGRDIVPTVVASVEPTAQSIPAQLKSSVRNIARIARRTAFAIAKKTIKPVAVKYRDFMTARLNGNMEALLVEIHALQHRQQAAIDRIHRLEADFETRQAAIRAELGKRLDDLAVVSRGPIDIDAETMALRTIDGFAAVAKNDITLKVMLTDAGVAGLESGTRLVIRKILPFAGAFVDVGAHIGLLTLAAARAVGSSGRIYAFEPTPLTYRLLTTTLAINSLANVETRRCAVGAAAGRATFHVSEILGHSSLYDLNESNTSEVEVEVAALDELLPQGERIDLVKIDVEGAELDVLKGMKRVIVENPEVAVIAEFGPSHLRRTGVKVEEWFAAFAAHGFSPYTIDEATGACEPTKIAMVAQQASVNILFAGPYSRAAKLVASMADA